MRIIIFLLIYFQHTEYDRVAEGYGGAGLKLKNADQIDDVFARAQELQRNGKAVLINAIIGRTNFREGSISV